MRVFDIVDDAGYWMRCCGWGRIAGATTIVASNHVVLYFCTGRKRWGNTGGMVYLMKDALVVKLNTATRCVVKRQEIVIE